MISKSWKFDFRWIDLSSRDWRDSLRGRSGQTFFSNLKKYSPEKHSFLIVFRRVEEFLRIVFEYVAILKNSLKSNLHQVLSSILKVNFKIIVHLKNKMVKISIASKRSCKFWVSHTILFSYLNKIFLNLLDRCWNRWTRLRTPQSTTRSWSRTSQSLKSLPKTKEFRLGLVKVRLGQVRLS